MSELLQQIEQYWTKRAASFADGMFEPGTIARWKKVLLRELPEDRGISVLDIGTGPGFFAILLAGEGYGVTAVDYTEEMLRRARANAGEFCGRIQFEQMDAQQLNFPDDRFDAIVTRNLTWNLERPDQAYREWHRVLKKGGILLNFDASWYEYLYDEEKKKAYEQDRENTRQAGVQDGSICYSDSPAMEEISRHLIFSRLHRPGADLQMLSDAGFSRIAVDRENWREVWDETEKINYASTPQFLLRAEK